MRLIKARTLLAQKQPKEAARLLEALLGINQAPAGNRKTPANVLSPDAAAAARYDLAVAYRGSGQPALADALLSGLAKTSKDAIGVDAQFLLGQEFVERGRFAEAIAPLSQYLSANPRGGVADYALGHLATAQLGLGKPEEAWKTLSQLTDRFPRSKVLPALRVRLGEAALDADQADRAAEQFRLVLGVEPGGEALPGKTNSATDLQSDPVVQIRAQAGLGRALWKLGKPADAAVILARALESWGDSPFAAQLALDKAGALEASGQNDPALAAFADVTQRYRDSKEAVLAELARARLLANIGRSEEAVNAYMKLIFDRKTRTRLVTVGEKIGALLAEFGTVLIDARQPEEADRIFTAVLEDYPEGPYSIEARFNLAESASQARNFTEVVRLLSPVVAAGPSGKSQQGTESVARRLMPLVLYRLGRTQIELGEWAQGAATLDRLIRDFPANTRQRDARFLRAEAALRLDDAATADSMLAALEADPQTPADPQGFKQLIRGRRVQSLIGLKRWREALVRAESLKAKLSPDDPAGAELEFARGRALLGLARPEEARSAFQAVIDTRKGGELAAQAQLLLGETFFHESRFREAVREYWKVDILHTDAPRWQAAALLEAGKAYERLEKWVDAVQTYESLCSRFPQDPHIAEAAARLAAARKRNSMRGQAEGKVF
jgi:TolA-binding protein